MTSNDPNDPNRLLAIGMSMVLAASGQSRQEVAILTGVSATHITKLLNGQSNPSQMVLMEFARAVECSISEIYRLGEAALEREREKQEREELRLVNQERSVETLVRVAASLDKQRLNELIEELQRLKEKHYGGRAA